MVVSSGNTSGAGQINEVLRQLRDKFVSSCQERMKTLSTATEDLKADAENPDALARVRRECHKIAGLAGSFGFAAVGDLAEDIDIKLKQKQVGWAGIEPRVQELMARLRDMER
ncbi:Hpt domain-containing protein [Ruegeria sp. SCP11]|uniref:Hpt domain-containing protein n=1 Tax=Ruegeria sp. SCP11 TaxID=3141378 RepID=UPI00333DF19A